MKNAMQAMRHREGNWSSVLLLMLFLFLTACGGGGGDGTTPPPVSGITPPPGNGITPPPGNGTTPPPGSGATPTPTAVGVAVGSAASATIGAAGGSLSAPDGNLTLTIPAGALATNTVIGIQPLTNMAHGKIGAAYRLTPEGQTFLVPVTLTFSYIDADLEGTAVIVVGAAFQTADGYWQWADYATFDRTAKAASIFTSHFSDWSLVKDLQLQPNLRPPPPPPPPIPDPPGGIPPGGWLGSMTFVGVIPHPSYTNVRVVFDVGISWVRTSEAHLGYPGIYGLRDLRGKLTMSASTSNCTMRGERVLSLDQFSVGPPEIELRLEATGLYEGRIRNEIAVAVEVVCDGKSSFETFSAVIFIPMKGILKPMNKYGYQMKGDESPLPGIGYTWDFVRVCYVGQFCPD